MTLIERLGAIFDDCFPEEDASVYLEKKALRSILLAMAGEIPEFMRQYVAEFDIACENRSNKLEPPNFPEFEEWLAEELKKISGGDSCLKP